ncbi:MAG: T9SS type A sorting domain-containing protein [Dysgonamonadaceae bacterium]|nr:T9SS type A sorting domain-containing protein [Dysgonamonadaceae bacterium]
MTDLTGKVILTAAITANEQTLDVDHLAPGSYLISISLGNQKLTRLFIKE